MNREHFGGRYQVTRLQVDKRDRPAEVLSRLRGEVERIYRAWEDRGYPEAEFIVEVATHDSS